MSRPLDFIMFPTLRLYVVIVIFFHFVLLNFCIGVSQPLEDNGIMILRSIA